jgi:hypothetical protein
MTGTTLAASVPDPSNGVAPSEIGTSAVEAPEYEVEALLSMSLSEFLRIKAQGSMSHELAAYEWTSDGCSSPVAALQLAVDGWLEHFAPACERHDWGYRNFGNGAGRSLDPTEERRRQVDDRLRADMRSICASLLPGPLLCRIEAEMVYLATRVGGALAFHGSRGR